MHQRTLAFAQFGILRKDDSFEVVIDPGPDKVEKRVLDLAPPARSTGVRPYTPPR